MELGFAVFFNDAFAGSRYRLARLVPQQGHQFISSDVSGAIPDQLLGCLQKLFSSDLVLVAVL